MNSKIQFGLMVAASLLGATSALGAESAAEAARRCGQILGERERLACFDRAFPAGPETAALAESRAAPAAAVVAAPVAAVAVAPVAPAPAAAAPVVAALSVAAPVAVAATATTAAVAAPAPALGDDQLRKPGTKESSEPKSLTAKVTGLKEIREDTWRFDLDNGQVWQQLDMAETFHPKVGDTVEIQRKMMGGYTLGLAGGKSSRWIRVSRVQ